MKTALLSILFLLFYSSLSAQNQQGYMTLVDKTADGLVYYISPLFECKFPGDHDGIDAQRIEFDKQFKAYILKNYAIVEFQHQNNNWLEPGRGVVPAKTYSKFLEFFPQTHKGAKMIMVEGFSLDCDK
ncbi:MAG: hypothetical protein AB8B72_08870 [Crocinitomicaceae bacterium]